MLKDRGLFNGVDQEIMKVIADAWNNGTGALIGYEIIMAIRNTTEMFGGVRTKDLELGVDALVLMRLPKMRDADYPMVIQYNSKPSPFSIIQGLWGLTELGLEKMGCDPRMLDQGDEE